MQHRRPVERLVERQGFGGSLREGGVFAIIGDAAGDWAGGRFEIIAAHPPSGADDAAGIDSGFAQPGKRAFAQGVVGQGGDHARCVAERRQRHGDIGFRAADMQIEPERARQRHPRKR